MSDPAAPPPADVLPAWDPKAEASVEVPVAELGARFLKGDLQLLGQAYPLVGQDGQVWDTPAEGVADALRRGYRLATKAELVRADAPGQNLQALAEGVLNGATFGLGGKLLVELGEDPDAIVARAEANPVMNFGGQLLGAGVAGVATGGFGVAGTAARLATAAGAGARTAGFVGGVAAGAVEGALYGAGNAVSEAALGRTDLTAERLLAGAGAGSFWGAAAGGPLGALLGKARPRDVDVEATYAAVTGNEPAKGFGKLVRAAQGRLNEARRKAAEVGGADPEFVKAAFGKDADEWLKVASGPREEVDALARQLRGRLQEHLAVGERIARTRPALPFGRTMGPYDADPFAGAEAARLEVVNLFRSGLDHVDAGRVSNFVNGITRPRADAGLQAIRNYRTQLAAAVEHGDDALKAAVRQADEGLTAVLDAVEDRVVAKNQFREQLQRELQSAAGGVSGRAVGAAAGGALGGPLGAALGYVASEAVEATARPLQALQRRAAQRRALQAVSDYAREGGRAFARRTKLDRPLPQSVRAALPRMVAPTTQALLDGRAEDRQAALARRSEELHATAFNPLASVARLEAIDDGDLPEAGQLVRQRLVEINEYLRSQVPQPLVPGSRTPVPDHEVRRFARLDAAVQDPLRLVDDLQAGRVLDPKVVEAVGRFYPSVLEDLQAGVQEALLDDPDALSWEQTLRLGIALGLPTHASLRPDSLATQQATAMAPWGGDAQASGGRTPREPKGAGRGELAETRNERLQER
jgi:hypothetical protein